MTISTQRRPLPPPVRLAIGLISFMFFGAFLLHLPISGRDGSLTWNEALFTATSALTVTGLTIITPASDLSTFGMLILLTLIQIGGVGFMVIAVVILRLLGRRISLADRLTLSNSLGLLSPAAIVTLTRNVLASVLLIEGIGALLLYFHWRGDPRLSEGQLILYALFHAVSAFCNAGFELFSGTPGYPDGIPRDTLSLTIMGWLIFLGGLGIPVIGDLLLYWRQRRFSLHTRITFTVVAFLVFVGMVGVFIAEGRAGGTLAEEPAYRRLVMSLFQSVSARAGGLAGIPDFGEISIATRLLLIMLMFIGCAPASMGGGITTGTFAVLMISVWSYARGLTEAQFGGRTLAVGTVRKAAAVLTVSLLVVFTTIWLLVLTHDVALDVAAFEVVSAFATCGLSLGMTGDLNLFGELVIVFMMFWGRLGALTLVVAITRQQNNLQMVRFPEEQILIG
ncbi:TrkH family potassium uptake protein [Candidatus Chloroploca sp. Khr17]|uniref:TrkH family potassium uptake protein n=1 Tax=Candidatus Chloroploca sp. Khr17 TaxID=2496869 RepID=UPI00101D768E|nr:potassium transporter TrkG [Candidatus Chloroploca sp. Khr17]